MTIIYIDSDPIVLGNAADRHDLEAYAVALGRVLSAEFGHDVEVRLGRAASRPSLTLDPPSYSDDADGAAILARIQDMHRSDEWIDVLAIALNAVSDRKDT